VIAGGAYSGGELDAAVHRDAVVAAHYADFDRANVRTERGGDSTPVYVSYRRGDHVYWTRHRVRLAKGELLLTDGTNVARARCGNRISFTPKRPIEAESPMLDLDTPEMPPPSEASADADGLADLSSLPLLAQEIFPPLLGNSLAGAATGGAAGTQAGGTGDVAMPPSFAGSAPRGFKLPQASLSTSTTVPPAGIWSGTETMLPVPQPAGEPVWPPPRIPGSGPLPIVQNPVPGGSIPPIVSIPPTLSTASGYLGPFGPPEDPSVPGVPPASVIGTGPVSLPPGVLPPVAGTASPMADVPEPGSWVLLLAGGALLGFSRILKRAVI
jgi:hypothetical protein